MQAGEAIAMLMRRVLIIDNNASLAETVAEVLSDIGYEVDTAFSGVQALAHWRRQPADLLVVDVDLPDIGGLALARRLLRRATDCKLVVMSAGDPDRLLRLCEELGATLLAKPFSPSSLVAAVRVLLERHVAEEMAQAASQPLPHRLLGPRSPRALLQHSRTRR